jgi:hypothetical protein
MMRKDFEMAAIHHHLTGEEFETKPGFWERLLNAIKASRLEKVSREIPTHLRTLDNATLKQAGFSIVQIERIRGQGRL